MGEAVPRDKREPREISVVTEIPKGGLFVWAMSEVPRGLDCLSGCVACVLCAGRIEQPPSGGFDLGGSRWGYNYRFERASDLGERAKVAKLSSLMSGGYASR